MELAIRRPRTVVAVWLVVFAVGLGLGGAVFGKLGGSARRCREVSPG
ncbi:hypothetical protein ACFQ9X_49110 [Catenulispora yoronensis]